MSDKLDMPRTLQPLTDLIHECDRPKEINAELLEALEVMIEFCPEQYVTKRARAAVAKSKGA